MQTFQPLFSRAERPSTLQNFPKRPPTQVLLSPRRKTELLLSKAQSRSLLNPNSIICEQDAPITQKFYYRQQSGRKTQKYKIYDEDARFIDYMRKQLERDKALASSVALSQIEYNSRYGQPRSCLDEFQETAHLRNPQPITSRAFESRYAQVQKQKWVSEVAHVEDDFRVLAGYKKQHVDLQERSRLQKQQKLRRTLSREPQASTPSRGVQGRNKFGSCGTGAVCSFCGQVIRCRQYVQFYEYIGDRVCCGCGQYIQ